MVTICWPRGRGDLEGHRHVLAVALGPLFLAGLEAGQQVVEGLVLLQFPQVLGIGRRNIDRDVAGRTIDLVEAMEVVVGGVSMGVGVLADIDAE